MALLIELPPGVEEELAFQAAQRGISASELVGFLLQLIRSPSRDGLTTSMAIEAETTPETPARAIDPPDRDEILSRLRDSNRRKNPDPVERKARVSALGKFAHIGLSTEALIAEKRRETAREDRP